MSLEPRVAGGRARARTRRVVALVGEPPFAPLRPREISRVTHRSWVSSRRRASAAGRERIHRSVSIHRARALDVPDDIVRAQETEGAAERARQAVGEHAGDHACFGDVRHSRGRTAVLERERVDCVFAYPGGGVDGDSPEFDATLSEFETCFTRRSTRGGLSIAVLAFG